MAGSGIFAIGDLKADNEPVEGRVQGGVAQIAFGQCNRCLGACELCLQGLGVADRLACLRSLLECRRERGLGAALIGSRFVNLLLLNVALAEQRLARRKRRKR